MLKSFGYKNSGRTWWKDMGDFYNVINIQNYSWNSIDSVDFRFNIGVALKGKLKDRTGKKVSYSELVTMLDEGTFLPDRKNRMFGNNQGYSITNDTPLQSFKDVVHKDFEEYILPRLDTPKGLADLIQFYEPYDFWCKNLKRRIAEN